MGSGRVFLSYDVEEADSSSWPQLSHLQIRYNNSLYGFVRITIMIVLWHNNNSLWSTHNPRADKHGNSLQTGKLRGEGILTGGEKSHSQELCIHKVRNKACPRGTRGL